MRAQSPVLVRNFFRPELSDKNCPATVSACISLFLAATPFLALISSSFGADNDHSLERTAISLPLRLCKERLRIWKLLGNVGNNILVAAEWLVRVQQGQFLRSFRSAKPDGDFPETDNYCRSDRPGVATTQDSQRERLVCVAGIYLGDFFRPVSWNRCSVSRLGGPVHFDLVLAVLRGLHGR